MLVRADGSSIGTVGGAALEERVKQLCGEVLQTGKGGLHHFDLQRWKPGGLPSLCGGSVDIALEYVPARANLLLWGGGHVAEALARILPTLEYDYSVADDRVEWIGADRFPDADRRVVLAPRDLWKTFDPQAFSHLYVLGYDAIKDLEVLRVSLDRFPVVIAIIASAPKREHMYASLRAEGVAPEAIDRIRSPVGLALGAETPAEIAISVVAELVQNAHDPGAAEKGPDSAPARTEADVFSNAP
jgi:xanthine dehydrogenase accessory factor